MKLLLSFPLLVAICVFSETVSAQQWAWTCESDINTRNEKQFMSIDKDNNLCGQILKQVLAGKLTAYDKLGKPMPVEVLEKLLEPDIDTLLVVDAISGLGVDFMAVDEWGVDVALAGSQKALMTPPGLSFVSVSERAWRKIKEAKNPRFYFDFLITKECYAKNDTPFTPAISLVRAVGIALKRIQKEGLEACYARHERMAQAVRAGARAMNLELFTKKSQTAGLTAIHFPKGIDGGKLLSRLKDEFGIWIAGGQGAMKGKIMRIGHMGYIGKPHLSAGFEALDTVLADMGHRFNKGAGREALLEVLEGQEVSQ